MTNLLITVASGFSACCGSAAATMQLISMADFPLYGRKLWALLNVVSAPSYRFEIPKSLIQLKAAYSAVPRSVWDHHDVRCKLIHAEEIEWAQENATKRWKMLGKTSGVTLVIGFASEIDAVAFKLHFADRLS